MENETKEEQRALIDVTFFIAIGFALSYLFGYINFIRFLSEFSIYSFTFPLIAELSLPSEYYIFNGVRLFVLLLVPILAMSLGHREEVWKQEKPDFRHLVTPYIIWYICLLALYIAVVRSTTLVFFPFFYVIAANLILLLVIVVLIRYRNFYQASFNKLMLICFLLSLGFTASFAITSGKEEAKDLYEKVMNPQENDITVIKLHKDCPLQLGKNPMVFSQSEDAIYIISKKQNGTIQIDMVQRSMILYLSKRKKK